MKIYTVLFNNNLIGNYTSKARAFRGVQNSLSCTFKTFKLHICVNGCYQENINNNWFQIIENKVIDNV